MTRAYDTTNRPRRTSKASGARGWYDSPEWKARSRAWLTANPICVRCPAKAAICDHDPPVRPHDRQGVLAADPVDVPAVPQREVARGPDRQATPRHRPEHGAADAGRGSLVE